MQTGARPRVADRGLYRFFSNALTYPLLFAIGVSMTPSGKLIAAFNLITIVATVATLMGTGALVGRMFGMYPIETAIRRAGAGP